MNANRPGTVDGESINLGKNCVNVVLLFTIGTMNGNRPGTIDGKFISVIGVDISYFNYIDRDSATMQ